MFASFYKLSGRPFQLSPDHRFFFGSRSHQKAISYLNYGLHQGEGFIVITGDIGVGKTTLVGHLLAKLDSTCYVAGKVVTTQLDADDTLRMVTSAFGIPDQGSDKATLLRRFETFLADHQRHHKRVVLLIDEAQNLPPRSLEELRMLSNFQIDENAPMQVILLGQPQFRQTLANQGLEQLRQRVIASHHLSPMDAAETRSYIEHRLRRVGWKNDPRFTDSAFERIFAKTDGVPRRINTLCTRVLLFGALEEIHAIDASVVEEVVTDLQQESAQPTYSSTSDSAAQSPVPATSIVLPQSPPPPALPPPPELPANGYGGLPAELTRLSERLSALEIAITQQDRTIRRVLEMAAQFLEQAFDAKDAPK